MSKKELQEQVYILRKSSNYLKEESDKYSGFLKSAGNDFHCLEDKYKNVKTSLSNTEVKLELAKKQVVFIEERLEAEVADHEVTRQNVKEEATRSQELSERFLLGAEDPLASHNKMIAGLGSQLGEVTKELDARTAEVMACDTARVKSNWKRMALVFELQHNLAIEQEEGKQAGSNFQQSSVELRKMREIRAQNKETIFKLEQQIGSNKAEMDIRLGQLKKAEEKSRQIVNEGVPLQKELDETKAALVCANSTLAEAKMELVGVKTKLKEAAKTKAELTKAKDQLGKTLPKLNELEDQIDGYREWKQLMIVFNPSIAHTLDIFKKENKAFVEQQDSELMTEILKNASRIDMLTEHTGPLTLDMMETELQQIEPFLRTINPSMAHIPPEPEGDDEDYDALVANSGRQEAGLMEKKREAKQMKSLKRTLAKWLDRKLKEILHHASFRVLQKGCVEDFSEIALAARLDSNDAKTDWSTCLEMIKKLLCHLKDIETNGVQCPSLGKLSCKEAGEHQDMLRELTAMTAKNDTAEARCKNLEGRCKNLEELLVKAQVENEFTQLDAMRRGEEKGKKEALSTFKTRETEWWNPMCQQLQQKVTSLQMDIQGVVMERDATNSALEHAGGKLATLERELNMQRSFSSNLSHQFMVSSQHLQESSKQLEAVSSNVNHLLDKAMKPSPQMIGGAPVYSQPNLSPIAPQQDQYKKNKKSTKHLDIPQYSYEPQEKVAKQMLKSNSEPRYNLGPQKYRPQHQAPQSNQPFSEVGVNYTLGNNGRTVLPTLSQENWMALDKMRSDEGRSGGVPSPAPTSLWR